MCTTICATPRSYCTIMAEGVGFEPTGGITPPAIFKTAAFNRSATLPWGRCGDSNPEPSDYKSAALPIEPHRHGRPGGLPPALTSLAPFCLFLILGCTPETYTTRRLFTGPSRTRTRILPYCRNFPGCSAFAEKILPTIWRAIFSHYFSPWSFVFGKSCRFPASQPCVDNQSWESLVMNTAPPPKPSVRGLLQVYPHSNPTEHFDLCSRITAWTAFTISSIFGLPSLYNHKESGLLMTLIPSIPSK